MKKLNKKGFTIVELVIVIAVIAILAGVLIPTFATVVEKANQSKAMQEAKNEYEAYLAEYAAVLTGTDDFVIINGKYAFEVNDGQFDGTVKEASTYTVSDKADLSKVYSKAIGTYNGSATYYTKSGATYTKVATSNETDFNNGKYYVEATPAADLGSTNVAIYTK